MVNEQKRELATENKMLRALLLNLLEKAEEENHALDSILALQKIFNKNLIRGKRLEITEKEVYISLPNGSRHEIEYLSSGERHLLSFLTLFLITARDRNFYLIDEPEISMSMDWQSEILPILSEMNPNSQIIVATHSPAMGEKNLQYFSELT